MKPCKGCGRAVVLGLTSDGKKIPLDLSPVYEVVDGTPAVEIRRMDSIKVQRTYRVLVSHSATCPKALGDADRREVLG